MSTPIDDFLFVLLAPFALWFIGHFLVTVWKYRNPIEWWYNEVDTRRSSGAWYYGAGHRHRECHETHDLHKRSDPNYRDPTDR